MHVFISAQYQKNYCGKLLIYHDTGKNAVNPQITGSKSQPMFASKHSKINKHNKNFLLIADWKHCFRSAIFFSQMKNAANNYPKIEEAKHYMKSQNMKYILKNRKI